jgi:four helix bundle protein
MAKTFRELVVWQVAMDLTEQIYRATATFPADERFGLTSQMRRAAVSIPSNIAEGHGRNSTADFRHFLGIARGSAREIETQVLIAERLDLIPAVVATSLADHTTSLSIKLTHFISTLEREHREPQREAEAQSRSASAASRSKISP